MTKQGKRFSKSKVMENAMIALIPMVKLIGIMFVVYSVTAG